MTLTGENRKHERRQAGGDSQSRISHQPGSRRAIRPKSSVSYAPLALLKRVKSWVEATVGRIIFLQQRGIDRIGCDA